MKPDLILFWILAAISVVTAIGVVTNRNPIRCALLLVLNFVTLAGFYVMQNAQVLAVLQILVYAGAIMVLFLFVIMLLNLGGELSKMDPLASQKPLGIILAAGVLAGLVFAVFHHANYPISESPNLMRVQAAGQQGIPQIQIIGYDMFTRYVYPFELTSVLLLVGVVGVMILTKRRTGEPTERSQDGSGS